MLYENLIQTMGAAIITVFENNGNDTLIVSLFNGFNFFLDIYMSFYSTMDAFIMKRIHLRKRMHLLSEV